MNLAADPWPFKPPKQMRLHGRCYTLVMLAAITLLATSLEGQARTKKKTRPRPTPTRPAPTPTPPLAAPVVSGGVVDERQIYLNGARIAWAFVDRNYQSSTGLARAHDTYQYVTLWDVASGIAATHSAHELGLITDAVYNQRTQRVLATLATMDLFDRAAFNKSYDSKTGRMIDRSQRISSRGY